MFDLYVFLLSYRKGPSQKVLESDYYRWELCSSYTENIPAMRYEGICWLTRPSDIGTDGPYKTYHVGGPGVVVYEVVCS